MAFPDFPIRSFTTAAVPAQSYVDIDLAIDDTPEVYLNLVYVHKLKITPSEVESNNRYEFYAYSFSSSPVMPEEILYRTRDFNGILVDPIEDNGQGPVERESGFVFPLRDGNVGGQLHLRIYNNHTADQTYTVEIHYSEHLLVEDGRPYLPFPATGGNEPVRADLSVTASGGIERTSGTDLTSAVHFQQVASSTRQKVAVSKNGGAIIGTESLIDFVEGDNQTFTIAVAGSKITVRIDGAGGVHKISQLETDPWVVISGVPTTELFDNYPVIRIPHATETVIQATFKVPKSTVVAEVIRALASFACVTAAGPTNNKFDLQMRYKLAGGAFSSYTSDVITMADSVAPYVYEGTNNVIPVSTVTVGAIVVVQWKRNVAVANNAAVFIDMIWGGISYTREQ